MLRLTLRAREDGRFLARIIERDGFAFVLDYGDPQMVADVSERIARGFSLYRSGKLETVAPSSPDLLPLLAEFYSQEGMVVALEEPEISERPETHTRLAGPVTQTRTDIHEPTELRDSGEATELRPVAAIPGAEVPDVPDLPDVPDEPTELVSMSDIPDVGDFLQTWIGKRTNPGALKPRTMWAPGEEDEAAPALPPEDVPTAGPADPPILRPPDEDEQPTELVSPEMRARAMAIEEGMTELHSELVDSTLVPEADEIGGGTPEPHEESP